MKILNRLFPGLDPNVKRALIAVLALGVFLLLLVSLPFAIGIILIALLLYYLWKRFPLQ